MPERRPSRPARVDPGEAVRKNRVFWQSIGRTYENDHAPSLRGANGRAWGFWRIPEDELRLLGPVRGRRILELGCGAAQWSVGLARVGARAVGLDVASNRLHQAQERMRAGHVHFPLLTADAGALPLRDASFDVVFCDWGAMTFCDPYRTVPEVARVLRSGGVFAFSTSSPLRYLCQDPRTEKIGRRLRQDYFGLHRVDFPDNVDYALPYGEWIRLFGANGLVVESLHEPRGGPERSTSYLTRAERVWSGHFPLEILWSLRKTGAGRGTKRKAHPRARSRPGHA
ncbi:MAG: class I SAM-dependent methyltransferase [Thermoplasmata archaeon]|nr:class I SAM-dependent methyltransferase [Thermoplasmata archaeon]